MNLNEVRTPGVSVESRYKGVVYGKRLVQSLVGPNILPLVFSWLVLALICLVLVFILYMTFVPRLPTQPGLTMNHWKGIARPWILKEVIPNTIILGLGTTAVATFFALPMAWLLNRTSLPYRNTFITLIAVSVIVPGFVKAMGWIFLVHEKIGLFNQTVSSLLGVERIPISVTNNLPGMIWVMGLTLTPTLFFLISGPMRAVNSELEEAAYVTGASQWRTLFRVSFPLVLPGIAGGVLYIFMTSVGIFEIPSILGATAKVPVLATELFYTVKPAETVVDISYGAAGVYAALIAAPSLVALYFYQRLLTQSHKYSVVTGKGYRSRDFNLARFAYLGVGFVVLYLILAVALPLLVLVWASLLPRMMLPSAEAFAMLSLEGYRDFLPAMGGADVVLNTMVLVAGVALLVVFFSFMVSWVVVRTNFSLRRVVDSIAILPQALPGLAIAFALFMIGLVLSRYVAWLPFAGTVFIIIMAGLVHTLSYGTRIANAALLQIHKELEEAGQICGAKIPKIMVKIVIPLVRPSLMFAGLWTALLTYREVTMALLLSGPDNQVLAVGVWKLWEVGYPNIAAAGAVGMVVAATVLVAVALRLGGHVTMVSER